MTIFKKIFKEDLKLKKSTKIELIYILAALMPTGIIMVLFTNFVMHHLKADRIDFTLILNIVMVSFFVFLVFYFLFFMAIQNIDILGYYKARKIEKHNDNVNRISEMLDAHQFCIVDYNVPTSNTDFEILGSIVEHYNLTYFAKLESDNELVTIIAKDGETSVLKTQVTPEFFLKRFS